MPPHDFKQFPELTNRQMEIYYFESPHKQLVEPFTAKVVKVTDGDTVRLEMAERDFSFPLRLSMIAAPELDEVGGPKSQSWLEDEILGAEVNIILAKKRVEKWGRLLGAIYFSGRNLNQESMDRGYSVAWEARAQSAIPDFNKKMENSRWS